MHVYLGTDVYAWKSLRPWPVAVDKVTLKKFITSYRRISVKNILIWNQNIIQPMHSVQYNKIYIIKYNSRQVSNSRLFRKRIQHASVGLVFLRSSRLPEDGTSLPKHFGVWYVSWIIFYYLCVIAF